MSQKTAKTVTIKFLNKQNQTVKVDVQELSQSSFFYLDNYHTISLTFRRLKYMIKIVLHL